MKPPSPGVSADTYYLVEGKRDYVPMAIGAILQAYASFKHGLTKEDAINVESAITKEVKDDPSKFLHDLYAKKDALKDNYLKTKSFKAGAKILEQPARPHSLILSVVLNLTVLYFLLGVFWSMSFFAKVISLAALALFNVLMERMISITKIDQGSQYGKKAQ